MHLIFIYGLRQAVIAVNMAKFGVSPVCSSSLIKGEWRLTGTRHQLYSDIYLKIKAITAIRYL
jgi:hypothetical protein